MRPHLAHINNTLIRKQLANEAGNKDSAYKKYKAKAEFAIEHGFTKEEIIFELEMERDRIRKDVKAGDSIYLQGVANAQMACIASLSLLINELREISHDRC